MKLRRWILVFFVGIWAVVGVAQEVKLLRTLTGHVNTITSAAFSPDGSLLAAACQGKEVRLWEVATGREVRTVSVFTTASDYRAVYSVAFSPDGRLLAVGSGAKAETRWETGGYEWVPAKLDWAGGVWTLGYLREVPSDKRISVSCSGQVTIWDVQTGNLVQTLIGHANFVRSVAFSPNGQFLASGSEDGTIRLWDVDTGQEVRTLTDPTSSIYSVAFNLDGRLLASGSQGGTIKLWNAETGHEILTIRERAEGTVYSVVFSPDGSFLASGAGWREAALRMGEATLWEVASGREVRAFPNVVGLFVRSVAFSPDGSLLASVSVDEAITVWDVETGNVKSTLTGHSSSVYSIAFSHHGGLLASGDALGKVYLWDVGTLLPPNTPPVAQFAFSPASPEPATLLQFNASASLDSDGSIANYVWNFGDGVTEAGKIVTHAYNRSGTFTATLTVTDDDGASDSTSRQITTRESNERPIPSFTWQALSVSGARLVVEPRTGDRILFDASESSDPDGEIVEYAWDWDSSGSYNKTTSDPLIEHIFSSAGSHRVTLRVTDDNGATGTVTKTVSIGAKRPPNAAFTFAPSSPSILDTVRFTDESADPDGAVSSWKWDFADGSSSTDRNPTHRYTEKKTLTVRLTVTDNDGLTDSATQTLTIRNLLPEARFSHEPEDPLPHQPARFDAGESGDADGEILSYRWDFDGDGMTDREGVIATWTFSEPGEYDVTLEVADDDQGVSSSSQHVTVGEVPPGSPRFSNLWGVVIGVGEYQDDRLSYLGLPEDDARAVYDFLVDRQGGGFPEAQVRLLVNEDATKSAIEQAWGWLLREAEEDDLVLIYFSGHGGHDDDYNGDEPEGDTQDEYLLCYDTNVSDMFSTAVRDDTVGDWARSLRSKSVILIFDSCHAGGAARSVRGYELPGSRAGPGNTLFTDLKGEGLLVMAACQAVEYAQQDDSLGYGVFTYFLLRGLGGLGETTESLADTDQDGRVSVEELRRYLKQEVPEHVSSMVPPRSPQNPLISGDDTLNPVALSGYGVPLAGEVITVQDDLILVSLGSRHGVEVGDRFEVVCSHVLPGGRTIEEMRAVIEVLYVHGADRSTCRVVKLLLPIEVKDQVRPAQE